MVVGSFGLILDLRLALWIGLVQLWLLRACGLGRAWGLNAIGAQVDGPLRTVPRRCGCPGCGSVAVAIAAVGWRWREQILGLVDQLLLLLLEIAKAVFGAAPTIDEMNHCTDEITDIPATLKAMATFLVATEAIHQIIADIFNVTGDGRHDLQELIKFLALGQIATGEGRDPFLEQGGFILGLVGQTPMLGAASHQAGVTIAQFQVGAVELLTFKRFGIGREIGGWGQEDHAVLHIGFHPRNAAAGDSDGKEAGSMRGVNSSGIAPYDD
ncbi:hypothetical protein [Synechococcus sp. CBW1006]|uniref:hypothetical protein n=1 Tax=Synechococcus sp. CBW1006 TaxID=1353138 RepID=UPI0018CF1A9D|nr:hypothetical protein [Synechococcus sp. CBW1006]QPN65261.1 hypothetical protein H8F26_09420 [Synechococcus sp. CBW1006]